MVFHALGREQIRAIADVQIQHLKQRLAEQDLELEVLPGALDKLGTAGFDPVYGARPLKRAIQTMLETPLAQQLLEGRFGPGDRISVDIQDEELVFNKDTASAA